VILWDVAARKRLGEPLVGHKHHVLGVARIWLLIRGSQVRLLPGAPRRGPGPDARQRRLDLSHPPTPWWPNGRDKRSGSRDSQ
jgi:hypothetical protein